MVDKCIAAYGGQTVDQMQWVPRSLIDFQEFHDTTTQQGAIIPAQTNGTE
jgi:hypothetical protein